MCRQIIIIKFQHTIFSPKSNKKIANEIFTQANENAIAITTQRKGNAKTFCNFSERRQKTICIIAERRRIKKDVSLLYYRFSMPSLPLCRWQSASVFDNVPNGENQIECKNGKLLKSWVQLSVKWVCQPQYKVATRGKESHREREWERGE